MVVAVSIAGTFFEVYIQRCWSEGHKNTSQQGLVAEGEVGGDELL